MKSRVRLPLFGTVLGCLLCACSGGPVTLGTPETAVSSGPVLPATNSRTYELRPSAASYVLPAIGGFSGSIALPTAVVAPQTTISLATSITAPAGPEPFANVRLRADDAGTLAIYLYVQLTLSNSVTFPSLPGITISLPAALPIAGLQFYYAISQPGATGGAAAHALTSGPATLSGRIVTFSPAALPLTLKKNQPYTIALYGTATIAPPPVKASGRIYVIDAFSNTVNTYDADGSIAPVTIRGLNAPVAVAVDSAGKIYVLSSGYPYDNQGSVTTYDADGTPTTPVITGLNAPQGIAVDTTGKIYVSNLLGNQVASYTPAGVRTTPTIAVTLPVAIAVDAAGKIYVVSGSTPQTLNTYAPTGVRTTPTITNFGDVGGIAVGTRGQIYESDFLANTISTYNADGSRSVPTISDGISEPYGIALDAAGNIYSANGDNDTITKYSAAGVRSTTTIIGVQEPYGIAVH